jgi:hypothetical protein
VYIEYPNTCRNFEGLAKQEINALAGTVVFFAAGNYGYTQ